ncbi:MAG TPA: NUDIX domain-containing protein [Gemmatimonadaceae bacterium]|jgi:8-oxo-dGTP pyrophosphatase MutT (NUDIX family)
MTARTTDLAAALNEYTPQTDAEARDVARLRALVAEGDPWSRSSPLHVTGSAVVVHPETARVLLRWHERMQSWLQVGGHADIGEVHPFDIALREAREETGLPDLTAWPDPARPLLIHVAIVPVPAGRGEPSHEHGDVRYLLATSRPADLIPESRSAEVRWFTLNDALRTVPQDSTRETIERVAQMPQLMRSTARSRA